MSLADKNRQVYEKVSIITNIVGEAGGPHSTRLHWLSFPPKHWSRDQRLTVVDIKQDYYSATDSLRIILQTTLTVVTAGTVDPFRGGQWSVIIWFEPAWRCLSYSRLRYLVVRGRLFKWVNPAIGKGLSPTDFVTSHSLQDQSWLDNTSMMDTGHTASIQRPDLHCPGPDLSRYLNNWDF